VIALLAAALMTAPASAAAPKCPLEGETALDCPWAAIGRAAAAAPDAASALAVIRSGAPALVRNLSRDRKNAGLLRLWGKSVNFDEHAKAEIVSPTVLAALGVKDGHAGLTHTYGYLFSVLNTPYGFKRARWVSGEVERGLGLPPGTFSPLPKSGTLLSNLTAYAGRVAFRGDAREFRAASGLRPFSIAGLNRRRLVEAVGDAEIRTDVVSYKHGKGAWLVYSWRDLKAQRAYLITAFPVDEGFAGSLFAPKGLGEGKPIVSRYNAFIPGVTGVPGLTGSRRVE
jgi:hypothetical protein